MTGTFDPPDTRRRRPALDAFACCVDGMEDLLAGVAGLPGWTLTEDAAQQRLGEVLAVRARVEELTARLTATLLARDVPRLAGAASGKAWLMATHGLSSTDAHRLLSHAHVADTDQPHCDRTTRPDPCDSAADLHGHDGTAGQDRADIAAGAEDLHGLDPADDSGGDVAGVVVSGGRCEPTRAAWAAGRVSAERAVLVGRAVTEVGDDIPVDATDRLQRHLLRLSPGLTFQQLKTVCRHAVEVVDPDGADRKLDAQLRDAETRALQQAVCRIWKTGDGTTRGTFTIPDLSGDLLLAALNAFAAPRRHPHHDTGTSSGTDATDQTDGTGWGDAFHGQKMDQERLSYPQRLGRALVELAEHLPTDQLPHHGGTDATLVITTDLTQLQAGLGEAVLDTGTTISAGQTRRLACNARLIPAVLDGPSAILDLGMSRRLFSRHQRLALALRDRGCIWPGCDRPPAWTEAHHITRWLRGGPTDLNNGCLLCAYHHHLVHADDGWAIQMAPDGIPEVIPPPRLDPDQTPRRHQRFTHHPLC